MAENAIAAQSRAGRARMKEIAREDAEKRQRLVADLLAGLGRAPTALDKLTIENLAAAHVRADRLRSVGRSDLEERRLIIQQQRALGMKPAPAEPVKRPTLAEMLAARGYTPPVVRSVDGAPEQRGDATPFIEARSSGAS